MSETETLSKLIKSGFKVEVKNPHAVSFNDKYFVYKENYVGEQNTLIKYPLVLDKDGNIIGQHG